MNLLIVDDEPIIRIGLRTLVDWEQYGLRLVGEAADGKEALELLAQKEVDILVTDIRMPRMDGLELIRSARAEKSDLGVLVLSCLDDFSFVKEAMKLGASDYILKPTMEPEELVTILLGMKEKLEEQRQEQMRFSQWRETVEQSRLFILSERLSKYLREDGEDAELERELIPEGRTIFTILLWGQEEPAASEEVEPVAVVRLGELGTLYVFTLEQTLSQLNNYAARYAIANALAQSLGHRKGRENSTLLIGPAVSRLGELRNGMKLHERQRIKRFYGEPVAIVWDDGEAIAGDAALPYDIRNDLLKSVASGNEDGVQHQIGRLLGEWRAGRPQIAKLQTFVFELLAMAAGIAREHDLPQIEEYEAQYVSLPLIRSFSHIDSLGRWLTEALRTLTKVQQTGGAAVQSSANPFIRKALQFMKENFHRNLGTVDIAEHVKLSRSYLSDLYSREMGESLIETLTRIRIDEAKRRLLAGDRKIYEVAEEVGFSDPKSFAKTFKRLVGCTPKEYETNK